MLKLREKENKNLKYNNFLNFLNKNSIYFYLKEIEKIPLLTREEEIGLAKRLKDGDKEAKEKLIVSNLRFVVSVAKKYQKNGIPLADLISEGNIGLINAIDKFDYKRGYHFISYAVWWIKQGIMKSISEKSRIVRLPMNRANELIQIGKFIEKYSKENGKKPNDGIIASELSISKEEIKKLLDISSSRSSIEELSSDSNGKEVFLLNSSVDDKSHPDNIAIYSSLKENIENVLNILSDREKKIIEYRFGLNGKEPQSLSKIGAKMNLTKERIRQIEKIAIEQIRNSNETQHLYSYLN